MKAVYTIADLPELAHLHPAARLGVIGNPIAHSISPPMQQAALDAEERAVSYIRLLCEREEGALQAMVGRLRDGGFIGANVTVPFKKEAYALASEADALSQLCGAANTLIFKSGKITCCNTDGPGFERAIEELSGKRLGELKVVLVGACGGAGTALAAQCVLSGCPSLTLANRPRPELGAMIGKLQTAAFCRSEIKGLSVYSDDMAEAVGAADLIVNATSLGLRESDELPLRPEWLRPGQVVYDLITHDTLLRRAAAERGCFTANGQAMLLWQGALAYEHWFGVLPPIEAMRRGLMAANA